MTVYWPDNSSNISLSHVLVEKQVNIFCYFNFAVKYNCGIVCSYIRWSFAINKTLPKTTIYKISSLWCKDGHGVDILRLRINYFLPPQLFVASQWTLSLSISHGDRTSWFSAPEWLNRIKLKSCLNHINRIENWLQVSSKINIYWFYSYDRWGHNDNNISNVSQPFTIVALLKGFATNKLLNIATYL